MFNGLDSRRPPIGKILRNMVGIYLGYFGDQGGAEPLQVNGGAMLNGRLDLRGGQLKFPATQVPSADANTLDDYEEGTFTPVLQYSTLPGTITYVAQNGWYTKIGRVVTINIYVRTSVQTGGQGNMEIHGLPFVLNTVSYIGGGVYLHDMDPDVVSPSFLIQSATTVVRFDQLSPGGDVPLSWDDVGQNLEVGLTFSYMTS